MDEQRKKSPLPGRVTAGLAKDSGCDDLAEYQAIAIAWAFSLSVISLQGDKATVEAATKYIKRSLSPSHKLAQIDPLACFDDVSLAEFLATEWGLVWGGAGGGIAEVVACIEKNEGTSARYLLLVERAESLPAETWQLLSTLCQLAGGRIGLLLGGEAPRLNEARDKFLSSVGLPVLCHILDNREIAAQTTVVMGNKQPLDCSPPPQTKTAPLLRKGYWIVVVILVLGLLFFQQEINRWIASDETTTAEMAFESDPPPNPNEGSAETGHDVENERLPKEREQRPQAAFSELTANSDLERDVEKAPKPALRVDENPNELLPIIAPLAVVAETPTPEPRIMANEDPLKTESWILSQPSQAYTLHVMSVRNEQNLRDFIVEKNLADTAAYYRASRESGRWFVLLVGHYADMEAAEKAVPSIEKKLNVKGIIIRKFEYSQADIMASRG